jgi:endonuclease/exonuclease/phosphatase (EEP) superfamily protein YafD
MASSRLVLIWRWGLRVLAVGYLVALIGVIAVFRLGDGWWGTVAALYLPRLGFAIPIPFLTVGLMIDRSWRWLLTQVVALVLIVFPLMGLHLSFGKAATPGAPSLRIVTFNIDSARAGIDKVIAVVRAADPDLIVLQEVAYGDADPWKAGLPGYQVDKYNQFLLASRFPIEERFEPSPLVHRGRSRSPRFVRYRIRLPGGPIYVYSVHPISPRESLDDLRGDGLRHELARGQIPKDAKDEVESVAALRGAQLEAVVADAARSPYPVIIAGDTNLPELSGTLARVIRGYRDAFADRGFGFGYTFPTRKGGPWMRIDRILAGARVRVLDCHVPKERVSDHLPVVATVEIVPST